jgi:hypothetical protein
VWLKAHYHQPEVILSTLMGHLITRFSKHPENLAVEALSYILEKSPPASQALLRLLRDTGIALAPDMRFRAQATGEDDARPDIEGRDDDTGAMVVLEAKFWAGLTEHQPITYIRRLPASVPSILAFIVPARRFASIWPELVARCQEAACGVGMREELAAEFWHAALPSGHKLALISWRMILVEILRALDQAHDREGAMDAAQLLGLCDRMDSDAFLPLNAAELSAQDTPRRHLQFAELANDIALATLESGICTNVNARGGKLTAAQGLGYAGRYLNLQRATVFMGYDCPRWAKHGRTPLWVRYDRSDAPGQKTARQALEPLRLQDPPRLIEDDGDPWVPLILPAGQEKPQVVRSVLAQLQDLKQRMARISPAEAAQ